MTQLDEYLSGLDQDDGWLVIFNRRPGLPPLAERLRGEETQTPIGRAVRLVRA